MGPPSCMRSVVDRNVVMRCMIVQNIVGFLYIECGTNHQSESTLITRNFTLRTQVVIFILVTSLMAIKHFMSIKKLTNHVVKIVF
jgi:hypothetical protein